jgi:hypothetical protein
VTKENQGVVIYTANVKAKQGEASHWLHFCPFQLSREVRYRLGGRATWDRCYDFLNIFAEKFGEKIAVFYSKQS